MLNEEAVEPWIAVNNLIRALVFNNNIDGLVSFPVTNYVNTSSNDGENVFLS